MPEISRFFGIVIAMYYDDHNPPHFHARYGTYRLEVDIRTLAVLAGRFPPKALGLVMKWARLHQMQDRDLARRQAELNKIAPLE